MGLTKSQYERISSEYSARRSRALSARDKKLADIRLKYPEYSALEDESTTAAVGFARKFLDNPGMSLEAMDKELHSLSERRAAFLRARDIDPADLEPHYTCPDCQDTGFIGNVKCHCFRQAEIELMYGRSNIRPLLAVNNFDNLREDLYEGDDLNHFKEAVMWCHRFIDSFDSEYGNLMLTGTVGTGKSFLSCCIAGELLRSGHSVLYFSAADFFRSYGDLMYGRSKNAGEDSSLYDSDVFACDLLIIDDLGTELQGDFSASGLFNCLSARHNAARSTIINTNLSLSDLHERYSDRVFSRLTGYYRILKLTGSDLRMKTRNIGDN